MSGKAELCEAEQEKETAPINNSESTTSESKELKKTGLIASVTYYFNRFRYYHFYCSDKVEKGLMIVILWLGRVLFNRDINAAINGY